MRKLKLIVRTTVDGFIAGPHGELDWMSKDWDDELVNYLIDLNDSCDTILMGRKMSDNFIKSWTDTAKNPESREYPIARQMVDYPKIVFTKTLDESPWANTTLAKGDIVQEVNDLKNQPGKDLVVYGGAGFVSSLIKENLIDEYHLFVIPVAISRGLTIFGEVDKNFDLELVRSRSFDFGTVELWFEPKTLAGKSD